MMPGSLVNFPGVVPAGATEARLVLQFLQPNGQRAPSTSTKCRLDLSDVVPLAGDYDHNGIVDQNDYVAWKNSFGFYRPSRRGWEQQRHHRFRGLRDLAR